MSSSSTICLTMIVKDEAHIIQNTLQHLLKFIHFSYWVICDTGSTDNTKEIITDFFNLHSIPGELIDTPWKDFGYNRTLAFEHAYKKADYAFVWDADDEIFGEFVMPQILTEDWYSFTFGNSNHFRYSRHQLFKNDKKWKYVGVLHEYPACCEISRPALHIKGNYYFISGRSGSRNKNPNKYLNDATILEEAFHSAIKINDPIHMRYAFYCAQSYNSANLLEKAIEWYKKLLALNAWVQEKYASCIEIFELYERLGTPSLALPYLVESYKYDNERIECFYRLIKYYCTEKMYEIAYGYYTMIEPAFKKYIDQNLQDNKLFVKKAEYDFYLPYYMIIVSNKVNKDHLSTFFFEVIFTKNVIAPTWWINNLYHNLQFSIKFLPQTLQFLQKFLDYTQLVQQEKCILTPSNYKIIQNTIDSYKTMLILPPIFLPSPSNTNIRVMMSFTTCKRLDLFKQTMNSIINTWKDLHMVDYFYCVDDNSSEEDRNLMKELYPFFNFYFKSEHEKGHRQSMNIIWNTLKEIKPTYWIHLEDDWLYFHPRNYISNSIEYLKQYNLSHNIHQIVFNKNYGLFYTDMERVGGIQLSKELILHEKREGLIGKNCGYWPHYSLQPSISITETILSLGNYDSPNIFFERDFANKYFADGYKTAFFPAIYSIHIGKQHWEKDGKNAYALNNINQFNNVGIPVTQASSYKNIPLKGTMKQHLDSILQKLITLTPFSLIRPSDGEYMILSGKFFKNADSWVITHNGILQKQLLQSIQVNNRSLYIGIPCNTCNYEWNCNDKIYDTYTKTFNVTIKQKTYANIFMNSNWKYFVRFMKCFPHGFYYIGSGTLSGDLPIKQRIIIDYNLVASWDSIHEKETQRILDFVKDKQNQVFCFSAGPLSKIWIPICLSKYPNNIYLDIGSSLDHITKGTNTRPYMNTENPYINDSCHFKEDRMSSNKNLLYMCVFFNKDYIKLLQMLLTSMKVYSKITFDILIITEESFYADIATLSKSLNIPLFIYCLPKCDSIFEAAYARLRIFEYHSISHYKNLFYIDTDIIIKKDISQIFLYQLEDLVYVISESTINNVNFGKDFFDFAQFSPTLPGINSGTLLFKNTTKIQELFTKILTHIHFHKASSLPIPACMDQPFISYNLIKEGMYNNTLLAPYVSLYEEPDTVKNYKTSILCHFTFPIGNFSHKFLRMKEFLADLLIKEPSPSVDSCICGWREGFCHTCLSNSYTLDWESKQVRLSNSSVLTPWGKGLYRSLHPNIIDAAWNGYRHIIYLEGSSFYSVRIFPQDFYIVSGDLVTTKN